MDLPHFSVSLVVTPECQPEVMAYYFKIGELSKYQNSFLHVRFVTYSVVYPRQIVSEYFMIRIQPDLLTPLLDTWQAKQAASPKAASSPSHSAPKKAPEAGLEDL